MTGYYEDFCYHSPPECKLAELWSEHYEPWRNTDKAHGFYLALFRGEVAYRSPSHRKAFRAGWDAFIAGVAFEAAPGAERGHRRAWRAGWAWADHHSATEDADTISVLRALGDRDIPTCLV